MAELTEKNISNENDGKGLEALKNLQNEQENKDVVQEEITKKEPVIDNLGRSYATGRRKSSIARVWIKRGKGKISVNGGEPSKHFGRAVLLMIIESPFEVADRKGEFDVVATVKGGGLSGQAGAIILGISKALIEHDVNLKKNLKKDKLTTRDSRVVERKKYEVTLFSLSRNVKWAHSSLGAAQRTRKVRPSGGVCLCRSDNYIIQSNHAHCHIFHYFCARK